MEWRIAGALFVIALATRLPFLTANLWEHDSVLYARAIESFDPPAHQPQPPGYLWYVLLARALTAVTGDPNRALTLISVFAAAVAVVLLYVLATRLYDERTGVISAIFLLTAVTFWGESAVAYPYTLLAALTTGCAILFFRVLDPRADPPPPPPVRGLRLIAASLAWGVAVGFRSDLAIGLAPLWILGAAFVPPPWAAGAALAAAGPIAVWLVASGALTPGGLPAFITAVRTHAAVIDERSGVGGQGLAAIPRNAYELSRFLGRGLYALAPLVAALVISRDAQRIEMRERIRLAFLLLWTFALLPVYLLVHVGEYGHVFTMLPGLAILAARGAIALARASRMPRSLRWVVVAVAGANAFIFLFSDSPLSAAHLERRDNGISEKVAWIRANVDPELALVVTAFDAVIIDRYLGPDYHVFAYEPDVTPRHERSLRCRANGRCSPEHVVVIAWDDLFRPESDRWRTVTMAHGAQLRIIETGRTSTLAVRERMRLRIIP